MSEEKYSKNYNDQSFWSKVLGCAKFLGKEMTHKALCMYYALQDSDTPIWAKGAIIAALGYFVSPIDAIPDVIPVAGLSDDGAVLAAAFAAVLMHIKEDHKNKATARCQEWFGD
jgi:uncharacterized membrane protein YkvA (DUF1232 family)